LDSNNNGIQDTNESGLSGVVISLYDANAALVSEATTDQNGLYSFGCVVAGNYKIRLIPPSGYVSSNPLGTDVAANPGTDLSDTDDNGIQVGSSVESPTFSVSAANPSIDFGITPTPATTTVVTTIAAVTIAPTTAVPTTAVPTTAVQSTPTTAVASSIASSVAPTLPSAIPTTKAIAPQPPATTGSAKLCSEVYVDSNGNGQRDAGEPALGGVTVSINGPVNKTATTDANGKYCFNNLPNGDYTVAIIAGVPAEYSYLSDQVVKVSVLGEQVTNDIAVFRVAPLALTGSQPGRLVGFGLGMLLAGGFIVMRTKRSVRSVQPKSVVQGD
jgi:hypothetical protein